MTLCEIVPKPFLILVHKLIGLDIWEEQYFLDIKACLFEFTLLSFKILEILHFDVIFRCSYRTNYFIMIISILGKKIINLMFGWSRHDY